MQLHNRTRHSATGIAFTNRRVKEVLSVQLIDVYRCHSTPSRARRQTHTLLLQCLPAASSRPPSCPPTNCSPLQHPINLCLQDSLRYATSYMRP